MRAALALLTMAVCGMAFADQKDVERARTAIAFVTVAPAICKSLQSSPGAMAAIMARLSQEDTTWIVNYQASTANVAKTLRSMMESGDEASACKMARDFETKSGLKLFVP